MALHNFKTKDASFFFFEDGVNLSSDKFTSIELDNLSLAELKTLSDGLRNGNLVAAEAAIDAVKNKIKALNLAEIGGSDGAGADWWSW